MIEIGPRDELNKIYKFLGIWESLYNPDFKPLEFEGFERYNNRASTLLFQPGGRSGFCLFY